MSYTDRQGPLKVDIDTRLTELWLTILDPGSPIGRAISSDEELRDALGDALRCAYGQGYTDALREEKAGRRGELPSTHGYRVP